MTLQQEREALSLIEAKIQLLQNWLIKKHDNPYASRVRKDLSALQVERATKQKVIDNLSQGLPSHGEPIQEQNTPNEKI